MTNGHPRNAITVADTGILTRGILMDIPRLKRVPYLEPGTRIYPADLEAWEQEAGIKVSSGDALFIRTGRWARRAAVGPWDARSHAAGLDASVIPWLRERDISILAGEAPQDAVPPGGELTGLPVHNFALVYLGVHLFDNVALDAVADAAMTASDPAHSDYRGSATYRRQMAAVLPRRAVEMAWQQEQNK